MADLESFESQSITDMSTDEAIEMLRQIRLSRRIPVKSTKKKPSKKKSPTVNATQAAELLKLLEGIK